MGSTIERPLSPPLPPPPPSRRLFALLTPPRRPQRLAVPVGVGDDGNRCPVRGSSSSVLVTTPNASASLDN